MAQERSVIKFIRPCLSIHEDKKYLHLSIVGRA